MESIAKAVQKVEEIMNSNPNTIVLPGMLIAKVLVGIDAAHPDAPRFNIPANIIGPKGAYVKHITQMTGGTRVQLKGRGSGFKESTGPNSKESDEPMYLQLSSNSQHNLDKAKQLAESLVNKVKRDFAAFVLRKDVKPTAPAQPQVAPTSVGYYPYPSNYGYTDPYSYYGYGAPGAVAPTIAPPGTQPPPPGVSYPQSSPPPPPPSSSPPRAPENKKRPHEDTSLETDTKRVKLDETAGTVPDQSQQSQQLDWNSMDPATRQYYEAYYAQYYAYYAQAGYGVPPTSTSPPNTGNYYRSYQLNNLVSDAETEGQLQELLQELEKGKKK
jgi:hypothetical protein